MPTADAINIQSTAQVHETLMTSRDVLRFVRVSSDLTVVGRSLIDIRFSCGDTRPVRLIKCLVRFPGLRLSGSCPPSRVTPVALFGTPTTYSCGYSSGFAANVVSAPDSLFIASTLSRKRPSPEKLSMGYNFRQCRKACKHSFETWRGQATRASPE